MGVVEYLCGCGFHLLDASFDSRESWVGEAELQAMVVAHVRLVASDRPKGSLRDRLHGLQEWSLLGRFPWHCSGAQERRGKTSEISCLAVRNQGSSHGEQ